jgi:hypothetical protein
MAPPDLRANGGVTEPLRGSFPWLAPSPMGEDSDAGYRQVHIDEIVVRFCDTLRRSRARQPHALWQTVISVSASASCTLFLGLGH